MSNEAFEKWAIDYGLDYESSFTRDDVEAAWQAAKAMCEQSEPVAFIDVTNRKLKWAVPTSFDTLSTVAVYDDIPLYTTPQPLKRLSDEQISEIAYKVHEGISPHNDTMDFANAIMDEMERINK